MTAEILHRMQFAFTLTFHYIYPPLSIGLSLAMIMMEGMFLKTKDPLWEKITRFWVKVFSLTFALGVATGIPLQFSLGTNWSRYSRFVGDVSGSLLGAEGLFAFAIEAGFLGILLFGWKKVSPKVHFLSTIFVALGAHFSALWIVSANSWMQTPAGYKIVIDSDGTQVAQVSDWWTMFLNPSNLGHLTHVFLSAWMTGGFLIVSISAYYLLKNRYASFAQRSMKVGLLIACSATFLQFLSGDHVARNASVNNPEKFAALEGVFRTEPYTPIYVLGWVDERTETVRGIKIPGGLSFLTYRDFETPVRGLDQFPKNERPWIPVVFQTYHIMVWMWGLMFIASLIGLYCWRKNKWSISPWLLRFLVISVVFPQIANITGWYTACMGRQPWTVYKLLKTKDAYSSIVPYSHVLASFIMFIVIYLLFFVLFLVLLDRKIKHGPNEEEEELPYRDIFKEDTPHG